MHESHFSHSDPVTVFGLIFIAAIAACWWLSRRNARSVDIDGSHIDLLLPLALLGGIAGGTLASWLMPADQLMAGNVLQVDIRLRLFAIVTFGALVIFVYSRAQTMSFRRLLDVFALPTVAALAIHRVGCFLAGCCWGDVSVADPWLSSIAGSDIGQQMQTLPWLAGDWVLTGVTYGPGTYPFLQQVAIGLIDADAAQSLPVHPVQLYEAALLILAFLVIRRTPISTARPGTIAAATAVTYAIIRFAIEFLRADGALAFGNLTTTQLQCIALLAISLVAARMNTNALH